MTYDAEKTPPGAEWLALDTGERIALIEAWHRSAGILVPRARLHATIHNVVESQIAGGEKAVLETMKRLRAEGLTRHEAIHAVGSVVAGQIAEILRAPGSSPKLPAEPYPDRLRRLTADAWRSSGEL